MKIASIIFLTYCIGWPFIVGFCKPAWHDFRVWYIQYRISHLLKRRIFGGRVVDSLKLARLLKKAEKLNIKLNLTIDSPGSASMGTFMRVNLIKP